MPFLHAPVITLLRASLLMLLAFGILVRPALNFAGELHGLEHAAEVAAEHGHAHPGDGHDADHDPDHAKGSHSLLHQADASASAGILTTLRLPAAFMPAALLPTHEMVSARARLLTSPFRPPIA